MEDAELDIGEVKVERLPVNAPILESDDDGSDSETSRLSQSHCHESSEAIPMILEVECQICHLIVSDLSRHLQTEHFKAESQDIMGVTLDDDPKTSTLPIKPSNLKMKSRRKRRKPEEEEEEDEGADAELKTDQDQDPDPMSFEKYSLEIISSTISPTDPKMKAVAVVDPKTGKHRCPLCANQLFKNDNSFQRHYQSAHLKLRFKCTLCGKLFNQRVSYRRHHHKAHMGVRFKCLVCNKTFTRRSTLIDHQQKTGCGGSESSSVPIPNYNCQVCKEGFTSFGSLREHLKEAHSSREFACDKCGRAFTRSNHLKEHLKSVHSKVREHECDLCGQKFKIKRDVKKHQQKVHSA